MKKHELQNILRGTREVGQGSLIQTAARYLGKSTKTGDLAEGNKPHKPEEAACLKFFAKENKVWFENINLENYIDKLHALVEQPYIEADEPTDLEKVKVLCRQTVSKIFGTTIM